MISPEHTLLTGTTGAGKTTLLYALVKAAKRQIVMTTKPSGFKTGYRQVSTAAELLKVLMKRYRASSLKICLRVKAGPKDTVEPIAELDAVSNILFQVQDLARERGFMLPIGLVVDEAHRFYPHSRPRGMDGFNWVISEGREWGISLVFATQRPTNVPPIFRDNVKNWYVLMLGGDTAVQTIKKFVGPSLKSPEQFKYALYQNGRLTHEGDTKKPKIAHKLP